MYTKILKKIKSKNNRKGESTSNDVGSPYFFLNYYEFISKFISIFVG